jgi:hypothetical protein
MNKDEEPAVEEKNELLATEELYKFCKEFNLKLELDKPFNTMHQMILKVVDEKGEIIRQTTVEKIEKIEESAGFLLNKISQVYPKR